ncbi:hypothetical protein H6F43_04300 [Leptolyngbya sp. FACHB-36]|uniref:hypothetical protein n=1 Tax=Leptolyngbya sp. FACHB-36 TaxID=2692808 RepID=UPI00168110FC|nr:hypothetical protein [Leptolyngbya sp. FACHB-36]MBD2019405.1 hypothetical protein [Leptolyngbya sp. FACHB-36]
MTRFSIWSQPTYTLSIVNYAEIPFTVRWAGSELTTNERAKDVGKLIWSFIVNPHLKDKLVEEAK